MASARTGQRPSTGRTYLIGHGIDLGIGAGADRGTDAFPGQCQGKGSADAAATAGDPGNSIVETHHASLLALRSHRMDCVTLTRSQR